MRTVINVSNRLPVTVDADGAITRSSGGLVAALEGLPKGEYELKWIGWPGGEVNDEGKRGAAERAMVGEHGCEPVWLGHAEAVGFYEGLSNSSIWPLLHYMPSYMRYAAPWWDDYVAVNRKFAERVAGAVREGDLVWVHDYQLMLVPAMLREELGRRGVGGVKIGFFLHTPFPSYELFRCHPRREDLLAGMLGADQIGFHTFPYVRNFRGAVLRLLGVESELMRVRREGRDAWMGVYPIGINAGKFAAQVGTEDHANRVAGFIRNYGGKRIVLSVERLDYTKGILRRLEAIDLFLGEEADRDTIKFIFVSVPSRQGVEEYRGLREEVESRIGRLNGKYATVNNSPIHFIHGSVGFADLCALYAMADVGLVTPLVDGMNLVAKEYVAANRADGDRPPGVLVLSEFAGAAEELFSAVLVNPYDTRAVADAIRGGLEMPAEERRRRMGAMRGRVMTFDAGAWARAFIEDLGRRETVRETGGSIEEAMRRLREAVAGGKRVGLFLDYDGTLREVVTDPGAAAPTPEVRRLLAAVTGRANVDVTVVSGRVPGELERWLGGYRVALVAEHGADLRRVGEGSGWEKLDRNVSYGWKEEVARVLRLYEVSTPGSSVEDKRTGLVWHYRRSDPEFGEWKARQLMTELSAVAANVPVHVRHGKKIVEVAATEVNKGAAIARLLEGAEYDLIVVAGDDVTDESMFAMDRAGLVSIKVGDGETAARYRVAGPGELRRLIGAAVG